MFRLADSLFHWVLFVVLALILLAAGDLTARIIGSVMLVLLVVPVIVRARRRFANPS